MGKQIDRMESRTSEAFNKKKKKKKKKKKEKKKTKKKEQIPKHKKGEKGEEKEEKNQPKHIYSLEGKNPLYQYLHPFFHLTSSPLLHNRKV